MKKEPMNLSKIKTSQAERVFKALSSRPKSNEVKNGVNLTSLAQGLAKRHVEKLKSSSAEEE